MKLRRTSFSKALPATILLILLSAVSAVFGAMTWFAPAVRVEHTTAQAADTDRGTARDERPVNREKVIEGETVTLTPRGFEPSEIVRSGGHFALNVDNRSGLKAVTFILSRQTGHKLREVRVKEGKLNWREVVNLPPGQYRLSEVSRPDWACRIEVSPR